MKITVFGLGYVGSVTAACLANRGHRVIGVDTDPGKVRALSEGIPPVVEPRLDELVAQAVTSGSLRAMTSAHDGLEGSDLSFVCVGTPSTVSGDTDLTQVRRVTSEIGSALASSDRPHTVVIRSTVPPGTVDGVVTPELEATSGRSADSGLRVAMCPEFLREGTGVADFFAPPFLVLGGSAEAIRPVRDLFAFLDCAVHDVPIPTAESIKYACNTFHALKVSFTNELARLYRALGVDARQVMNVFVQDHTLNISPAYLRPGFAFGGSCLPKDLRSVLQLARAHSVDLPVLQGTLASNDLQVRELADRVVRCVEETDPGGRRVSMLGLSFKNDTDDLRESPQVSLAEILIGKGFDVRIHDPVVNPARLRGANLRFVRTRLPHLHRVLYDTADGALRGTHVAIISTGQRCVVEALAHVRPRAVFDLHGRLGADVEALTGYQGVGW